MMFNKPIRLTIYLSGLIDNENKKTIKIKCVCIMNLWEIDMIQKKLFGNDIEKNCDYCLNLFIDSNFSKKCIKNKKGLNLENKCKYFSYDPLQRKPKIAPELLEYSADDFKI